MLLRFLEVYVFPNESDNYRTARNALLEEELLLKKATERVAALRRALPLGGPVPENYEFLDARTNAKVRMNELFAPHDTIILYNFMFAPGAKKPCPSCTSFIDGIEGNVQYIEEQANFAVVAKAGPAELKAWADNRGWRRVKLLSSKNNKYNAHYRGENEAGVQLPAMNVFHLKGATIHHTYALESLFGPRPTGGDPRHADAMWPLWNVLDLTPSGRGEDWYPNFQT
jgi:predicted dithiol-disulfide oxidoreductase (DUF899 family)